MGSIVQDPSRRKRRRELWCVVRRVLSRSCSCWGSCLATVPCFGLDAHCV